MKSFFIAIVLLLGFLLVSLLPQEKSRVQVVACDVGQGDAILLLYDQLVILIDTGPNSAVLRCLQARLPLGHATIDLLILTHADKDHIGGFSDIVKTYKVKRLWVNPKEKGTEADAAVRSWMAETGKSYSPLGGEMLVVPGMRLQVVWSETLHQRALGPSPDPENFNLDSIGILLTAESFGFLSLGDLECREELAVAHRYLLNRVRLLKMSHHGAKTSSCLEFLRKVHPEVAFYSAGKGNSYGHPHPDTLRNAEEAGIFVVGTDAWGDLTFQATDSVLRLEGSKPLIHAP